MSDESDKAIEALKKTRSKEIQRIKDLLPQMSRDQLIGLTIKLLDAMEIDND